MYRLSKFIPVRMHSTYTVVNPEGAPQRRESARWIQWRGRIWAHHITPADLR